jgi:hypothetical protein
VLHRCAQQLAARFHSEQIALAIASEVNGRLRTRLQDALLWMTEVVAKAQTAHMPSRDKFLAKAKAMFATSSLDDIVDQAYELLFASVRAKVAARLAGC